MNKRSFVPATAKVLGWVVGVLGVIATLGALLDGGIAAGFAAAVGTTFSVIVIFGIGVTVSTLEDIRDALVVRTEAEVEADLPGRTLLLTLERMAPPPPSTAGETRASP